MATCMSLPLTTRFHSRLDEIEASAWNALLPDDNPFLDYAFLSGLECHGCLHAEHGWLPRHLALYSGATLVAAAPAYVKLNSHGEYVFDWSWASAWERAGGDYYPKLLNAVPYSPVTGQRLLAGNHERTALLQQSLVAAMKSEVARLGLSSAHCNFLLPDEDRAFGDDWLQRSDIQFHWHNHGYRHFPDFLATLKHKKRKNILRERTQVAASGLTIEWRSGESLDSDEWQQVHGLYEATFDEKGNHAALTAGFFDAMSRWGSTAQLALARDGDKIIAMALFLRSADVLYGRYWGTSVDVPGLHFELCYYQGIDYAIRERLKRVEPGAQGEHKLARGFLPHLVHSRHYLPNPDFRSAVADALVRESAAVAAYANELGERSPYAESAASDR